MLNKRLTKKNLFVFQGLARILVFLQFLIPALLTASILLSSPSTRTLDACLGNYEQHFAKSSGFQVCTGKSLSEALIFASTNPQYDDRLFIELQVQYIKIPSSNLGRTCCVQKLIPTFRTTFVHNIFSPMFCQKEELLTKIYLCSGQILAKNLMSDICDYSLSIFLKCFGSNFPLHLFQHCQKSDGKITENDWRQSI